MKRKINYFLIVMLMFVLFFSVDYSRAQNNKPPLFAINTEIYKDGGTKEYQGIGYKVLDYNE